MRRAVRLPLEQLAPYLLDVPSGAPALDWHALFANAAPVEIEVGSGKGLFLLSSSQAHPDINYVGIEIERKYQLYAANRLAKRGLKNVRLVCADARTFLGQHVAPASVQAVHVYFPDPWWKKRHHKRRVFTAEFTETCARVLVPGGRLHVASDVGEYFAIITDLLNAQPMFAPLPSPAPREPVHDFDYLGNFERKYRKEGKQIGCACYERTHAGF